MKEQVLGATTYTPPTMVARGDDGGTTQLTGSQVMPSSSCPSPRDLHKKGLAGSADDDLST